MTKLLAFSDIHMKPEGQLTVGVDPFARFQRALAHALEFHSDAQHIVLMGDLANSGKPVEYDRVAEVLAHCPLPIAVIPGNHDDRGPMAKAIAQAQPDYHGHIQSVIETPSHRVICLDTVYGPPHVSFAHMGVLDDVRAAWLADKLASTNKSVLLITHHPVHKSGFDGIDDIRLRDDDRFYDILRNSGRQIQLLSGHVHRNIAGSWRGFPFFTLKSTAHQTPLMGLGDKNLNVAVDEPGAYGVLLLNADGVIIHTEDFDMAVTEASVSFDTAPDID